MRKACFMLFICLMVLFPVRTFSEDVLLDTTNLSAGVHYFKVTKNADGSVSAVPFQVIKLSSTVVPIPTNPTNPDKPPVSISLKSKVLGYLETYAKDDTDTVKELQFLYSFILTQLENGKVPFANVFPVISQGTDKLIEKKVNKQDWSNFRKKVSDDLSKLAIEDKLTTKQDHILAINSILEAFSDYTANRGILDNLNLARIMEIIKMILEIIALFT